MNAENLWLNASAILGMLVGAVSGTWWLGNKINEIDRKIAAVIEQMSSKYATISRVHELEKKLSDDHDNITRVMTRIETIERNQ